MIKYDWYIIHWMIFLESSAIGNMGHQPVRVEEYEFFVVEFSQ